MDTLRKTRVLLACLCLPALAVDCVQEEPTAIQRHSNSPIYTDFVPDNVFTVTNTADAGLGSLRQAILDANATVGNDLIEFHIPGDGPHKIEPLSQLPNITEAVVIDGYTQPGASANTNPPEQGSSAVIMIELDCWLKGGAFKGLVIEAGNSTVRGLALSRFSYYEAIMITGGGGNTVEGNFIGVGTTGREQLFGNETGIRIANSPNNVIGGISPAARNVISGSGNRTPDMDYVGAGIRISGTEAAGNVIQGNLIGMDARGTSIRSNLLGGILIGAPSNQIGGETPASRNVISGNGLRTQPGNYNGPGISIFGGATGNVIQGNYIGLDVTGAQLPLCEYPDCATGQRIGNVGTGVSINVASDNVIGGTTPGARNVISGNNEFGIELTGNPTTGNIVRGNYIGTDASGSVALGNGGLAGVKLVARGNTVGGTSAGAGNVISGNHWDGISLVLAAQNVIQGNLIGLQADGESPLGNYGNGIAFGGDTWGNLVGGSASGAANVIAFNHRDGVFINAGSGNVILGNSLHSNGQLGIDLGDDGVTPNDADDSDAGANGLQNFPQLTGVGAGGSSVAGALNSAASTEYTVQFFSNEACDPSGHGEGASSIGEVVVTTDVNGSVEFTFTPAIPLPAGGFITATASGPDGTSEFSECLEITLENTPPGTSVEVQPVDPNTGANPVTVTFDGVTEGGTTSLETSETGPPPPEGFKLGSPPVYFDVTTTASSAGMITVCLDYSEYAEEWFGGNEEKERSLKLFHRETDPNTGEERWADRTSFHDLDANVICAEVTSLSLFVSALDGDGPVVSSVMANPNPVAVNAPVNLSAFIDDASTGGSIIASADYSLDGRATWIALTALDGAFDEIGEDVTGTAVIAAPGVLEVCVRGIDGADNTGSTDCILLAAYDPEGGFVTGGGWINSPEGAYKPDPALVGKASFGFVSKYKKGTTELMGKTEFQFRAGDLNLHSTSYEWLVVTGSDYARFKGSGTINGMGDYRFMLWAGDGSPDTFRIRIWEEDESTGVETVIYDNGFDQPVAGGSIVVHTN
jgi:hypothetical protein